MTESHSLPPITSAMLIVTHACNLACRYCFVHQEPSRMTLNTAKQAARFLLHNAENMSFDPEINFFGGEPLLMWDSIIRPLVSWVRDDLRVPMKFGVTTNGTLLTDERIEFLARYGFGLLLSMDGDKATQDYNRPQHSGAGSFDLLEGKIPTLLKHWPGMTLRMTTIPETCEHVFENIMWGAAYGFMNFFVVPNVFEPWPADKREVLADEIRRYADYYAETRKAGGIPIRFSSFEEALNDIPLLEQAERFGDYRIRPKCKAEGKCGLGATRFASIHPNGNIYGCQEMTSNEGEKSIFYIGSLADGVDNDRRLALMRAFSGTAVRGDDCAGCPYDRICDGGCVANNYLATGSLNKLPEMYCWWKRLLLSEAKRIYREVR